ncbi:MAG: bifunctional phosphoribosyl-AMP cyclohydrolase/phosphoribosyl-ATP diphosphatase HisIE [Acidobacteriota bacterium]
MTTPEQQDSRLAEAVDPASLKYDDRGLLPVVVQGNATGAVLMVAWANREAVEQTIETGYAHFYSRSRQELWKKGGTSGNTLRVTSMAADCDRDTLVVKAFPAGPACHKGDRTCWGDDVDERLELGWLHRVLASRFAAGDETSYTAKLLNEGTQRVAQKVGEEGVETALAAVALSDDPSSRQEFVGEVADLLYHVQALLLSTDVDPLEVALELERRHLGLDAARSAEVSS